MKLYITESNLNFLTEFLNAVPIFVRDGQLFYATPSGLSFCSIHSGNRKREIPLDDWEPFDEVFYLPSIDRCVFAHFRPTRVRVAAPDPSNQSLVDDGFASFSVTNRLDSLSSDRFW